MESRIRELTAALEGMTSADAIALVVRDVFRGRIAVATSFGAESAVLLHLVALADPATPVLFVDTGKLFGETKRHRDALIARLGLRDVRTLAPDPATVAAADPDGFLFRDDPDRCCALRKVAPFAAALAPFAAWLNGRKRHHGQARADLPLVEADGPRVKLNPLAAWTAADIEDHLRRHDLPRHPLVADGFASIGCMPCTARVSDGEAVRAGRWRGWGKTECGLHRPAEHA
jgi:phosphoadenosine phosphosulfate reductase